MKRGIPLLALLLVMSVVSVGQVKVEVAPKIQKYLGDVSELDRTKYFNFHSKISGDTEVDAFKAEFDIKYGRGFWAAFSAAKQKTGVVGNYPVYTEGTTDPSIRAVSPFIATEHPANVARWNVSVDDAAKWAVEYYLDEVDDSGRPEFFEPMNEPFVHAGDDVFTEQQPDNQLMRERMADWFGAVGEEIHNTPELANMKVVGYSSAWPSLELWDFGHWDSRMKMFMDRAGEHMDAFATHLYDGINVTGADSKRSGSNSEAILDLIETYSVKKWGIVKPHAITEYGGIEKGYGDQYSDIRSVQTVKSLNHILFNLLDRENDLAVSIPFIGDKALWHINAENNYYPYGSVLWRPEPLNVPLDEVTGWVYTPRIYFFELWKDVRGKRVYNTSSNPDIQTQAFVDGNKLFVALSNLDDNEQAVNLAFFDAVDGLSEVKIKRLKIYKNDDPSYTESTQSEALESLSLEVDETVVLEYSYQSDIVFNNVLRNTKYYSSSYLNSISGSQINYEFNNVAISPNGGYAKLRMSIGRKHDKSKKPTVTVNGSDVAVPNNWAGYDQASRDDFFGMIEIPVPIEYIQENNVVSVKFPDTSGRVASLILQVGLLDNQSNVSVGKGKEYEVKVYPTNVSEGWMKIELQQPDIFTNAEIIALTGVTVKNEPINRDQNLVYMNDLGSLSRGIYILKLSGNGHLFTQKIVIK